VTSKPNLFWEDHERDLQNPEYAREYALEEIRVATIDHVVNTLIDALNEQGLSKAALARAIGSNPAVVRRLLSASGVNPTVGTVAEAAAVLGMRVVIEPMPRAERKSWTQLTVGEAPKGSPKARAKTALPDVRQLVGAH
jgi:transcriptional regulator with XRE-family HTH domain